MKPTETGLCLTDEEANYLDQIIAKLPTSYGMFFVDFFRAIQQKRKTEIEQPKAVENESELLS